MGAEPGKAAGGRRDSRSSKSSDDSAMSKHSKSSKAAKFKKRGLSFVESSSKSETSGGSSTSVGDRNAAAEGPALRKNSLESAATLKSRGSFTGSAQSDF